MIRGTGAGPPGFPVEAAASLPHLLPGLAPGGLPGGRRIVDIVSGPLQVRLAESQADIEAAQALRYRIFYEIMGARPLPGMEHAAARLRRVRPDLRSPPRARSQPGQRRRPSSAPTG